MDVLCAPSQTTARWREQFGRMLIEAFACGVAVIASTSGEIPHVVGDAGIARAGRRRPSRGEQAIRAADDGSPRREPGATRARAARIACTTGRSSPGSISTSSRQCWPATLVAAPHDAVLRVALCADFPEERWPSMDRVACKLLAAIGSQPFRRRSRRTCCCRRSRGAPRASGRPAASRITSIARSTAGGTTRVMLRALACRYDCLPHRRSQLFAARSSALPADRTIVTCHDLDTFRSVLSAPRTSRDRRCFAAGDATDSRRTSARRPGDLRYGCGPRRTASASAVVPPERVSSSPRRRRRGVLADAGDGRRRGRRAPRCRFPGNVPDRASRRQHDPAQARRRPAARSARRCSAVGSGARTWCASAGRSPPSRRRSRAARS